MQELQRNHAETAKKRRVLRVTVSNTIEAPSGTPSTWRAVSAFPSLLWPRGLSSVASF